MRSSAIYASVFCALLGFNMEVSAQKSLRLESKIILTENNLETFVSSAESDLYQGRYYRIVQFVKTPTQAEKENMIASGLRFFEYLPDYAYYVSFPSGYNRSKLHTYGVYGVYEIDPEIKINPKITSGLPASEYDNKGLFKLIISYHNDVDMSTAKTNLIVSGYTVEEINELARYIVVNATMDQLEKFAEKPEVKYLDYVPSYEPDDDHARAMHRSLNINTYDPLGNKFDGTGVTVAVNDDGFVGPHIDFTGRTNQTDVAGDMVGDHGDMVAGILGGAGNLDPRNGGMAKGTFLFIRQYSSTLPNTVTLHQNNDVMIFSSSYSNGCNDGYTSLTNQVDQEIRNNPSLIQVFSAGNAGTSDCSYGAGANWGNITGGHKMAKNVITTANLDRDEDLMTSSSRGPAHDGRIKPDISSNGNNQISTDPFNGYSPGGGTSAAAPGMSGITAQLYHAYKTFNAGVNPESALIKAALLNSAEDFGNAGPDFKFGWGRVHALRALDIIQNNQYVSNTITQGQNQNTNITVPAGVKEVRFMLYWADYEAASSAAVALVNDLDLTVNDGSVTHLPWLLDHTPNVTALNTPAGNGADHLNNMEQVAIVNPTAGSYTINVDGFNIPQGPQKYYIVYTFIYDEIKVIYPNGGEGLVPGESERIFWDAYGTTGTFDLEYSADNGSTWNAITSVAGSNRSYVWNIPSNLTGQARFRISRGADIDISDTVFSILNDPDNLAITNVCPNYIQLQWDAVTSADSYIIYALGSAYMDSVGATSATTFQYPIANLNDEQWFAVAAIPANNTDIVARRCVAVHYSGSGILNCTQPYDLSTNSIVSPGAASLCDGSNVDVVAEIKNAGQNPISNFQVHYQVGSQPIVSETYPGTLNSGITVSHTFSTPFTLSTPGIYELKIWTSDPQDVTDYNDTASVMLDFGNNFITSYPYTENFQLMVNCGIASDCELEVCTLTNGWTNLTNGADDDIDWRVNTGSTPSSGTGPSSDHTTGMSNGKYVYLEASGGCSNQEAIMISPCIDLSMESAAHMNFWYHMLGSDMGALHVDVFNGTQWINDVISPIAGNHGGTWQLASVPLNSYVGETIRIRFRGVTGIDFESDMALDDINISNTVSVFETELESQITVFPNPTNDVALLSLELAETSCQGVHVVNTMGQTVYDVSGLNISKGTYTLDLSTYEDGLYFVRVITGKGTVIEKLVKR